MLKYKGLLLLLQAKPLYLVKIIKRNVVYPWLVERNVFYTLAQVLKPIRNVSYWPKKLSWFDKKTSWRQVCNNDSTVL